MNIHLIKERSSNVGNLVIFSILFCCCSVYAQVKTGDKALEIFLEEIYNSNSSEIPTLKSLEGNVVVLYFWATWCRPCVESFPKMNELYKKYENSNVKIIAVTNAQKRNWKIFLPKRTQHL